MSTLEYQYRMSTLDSLTQHLPLYYRMKRLYTLFQRFFRGGGAKKPALLYHNKGLYLRLLDNIEEQTYTS